MPLQRRFRLIGVQVGQARQRGQPLVPLGVVLHRAGAERIEVRVDRHVLRREVHEVPHQVRLGQLRQRRRASAASAPAAAAPPAAARARRTPAAAPPGSRV